MSRFIAVLAAFLASAGLWAQTPEEILEKMDKATERFDTEGLSMVMDIKIPLLGTYSTTMEMVGNKYKAVLNIKGTQVMTWSDGVTSWIYDSSKNELVIENADPDQKADDGNLDILDSVSDGYDVTLKKETPDAWYFVCTKTKDNPNKDDPKKIDLAVSKHDYLPVSTSVSQKGVTITLRDFKAGVTQEQIKFDQSQFGDATIKDKRESSKEIKDAE